MKQAISILAFALLSSSALLAQAQDGNALLNGQVLAAANISPLNATFDARVADTRAIGTSKEVAVITNNRPHPKYGFNINRIHAPAELMDHNQGKHFVYVAHPKNGFLVKRYVG
ncbi:hypothetical protein [Methylobacillus sp.]|uniref:hypothetical protein n=1 Tax=Methylobacillus sp. TaxID=56818 RepID=UPI0012D0E112|nr:hypothetical protein [Methylobacillus sp.]MPS49299.1 hypothetical protein [Methylobacillus sp.]